MSGALDSLTEALNAMRSARLYLIIAHQALERCDAPDLAEQVEELMGDVKARMDLVENGPSDAELEVQWNGPDAHEAHRAAWALAQGIESGEVA